MKIFHGHFILVYFLTLSVHAQPTRESLEKLGAKITLSNNTITQIQIDTANFTEADFKTLGQCTTLRKLTINGKTLNDTTLSLLAGLTNLEELSTNQTSLSDDGYKGFAQFKNLRSLALFHPSWDLKTFTGAGLANLKDLPKLEKLTFAGSTAGDTALEAVSQIAQLKDFATWHTMQTQEGNKHLLKLRNLTALRIGQRLPRGGQSPAPSLDAVTIPILAQIKTLQKLELFEARLTAKDLAPLADLPALKDLKIHTSDISQADIDSLKTTFKSVKIDFKPMSDEEKQTTLVKKLKL